MFDHADAARFEEEEEMVDQDTAPKELFYTEGTPALREARLQACCPSPTLLRPLPCVCCKPVPEGMLLHVVFS